LIFQAVPPHFNYLIHSLQPLTCPLMHISLSEREREREEVVVNFSLGRGGNFSRRRIELEAICRSAHTLLSRRKLICTSNVTSTTFSPRDIRLTAKNRIHRRGPLLLRVGLSRAQHGPREEAAARSLL
jgi:hypothetical protein